MCDSKKEETSETTFLDVLPFLVMATVVFTVGLWIGSVTGGEKARKKAEVQCIVDHFNASSRDFEAATKAFQEVSRTLETR